MHIRAIFAIVCLTFLCACSKSPGDATSSASSSASVESVATISNFPATLEGNLTIGDSNDWGYFGDVTVAGTAHPVAIPASIFEASGVPNEGGKVRVTLASKQNVGNSFQYVVSSITKL